MPPSPKHQKAYNFIRNYINYHNEAPKLDEIGSYLGLRSSASVYNILVALENQGLIERVPNVSRGIRLVSETQSPPAPSA